MKLPWPFNRLFSRPAPRSTQWRSERLVLRLLELRDTAAFARYAGDPGVARWMFSFPSPYPRRQARARIRALLRQHARGQALPLAVTMPQRGEFIGVAVIFIDTETKMGELAYWIARPFWRRGYGREAVTALVGQSPALGLQQLEALIVSGNRASAELLKSLGFQPDGSRTETSPQGREVRLLRFVKRLDGMA